MRFDRPEDILIAVIVWGCWSGLCAWLSYRKGRPWIEGVLFSLFGPFGMVFIVTTKTDQAELDRRKNTQTEIK